MSSGFPHQAPEALIPNRAEDLKESRTVATEVTVVVYNYQCSFQPLMKRLIPVFKPVLLATPCHRAHRALRASHFCSFSKPGRLRIDRLSSGFPIGRLKRLYRTGLKI
jgi:hypothetical protein